MNSRITSTILSALLLSACGPVKLGTGAAAPTDTTYALDGVKYISPSIARGDDSRTFNQRRYTIASDGRVLLRFESLSANQTKILSTQPILIRIFAVDATEQAKAVGQLRACPIVDDWMMAATWKTAHPYRGGEWRDGAPIEDDDCVQALAPASATGDCAVANAVCFDVSDWYKHYVVERGINYGHALVSASGEAISILGDAAPSKGPRIQWSE